MIKKIIVCALMVSMMMSMSLIAFGADEESTTNPTEESGQMPPNEMPQRAEGQIPGGRGGMRGGRPMPNGDMPHGEMPNMTEGQMPQIQQGEIPGNNPNASSGASDTPPSEEITQENTQPGGRGQFGGVPFGGEFEREENVISTQKEGLSEVDTNPFKEYFTPILSVVLLAAAFVFVIFYKRKTY